MTAAPEADPLAFARALVDAGVPVLACPPGGTAEGYQLPSRWQQAKADPKRLNIWRPGWALMAVCGVQPGGGVDVLDLDPRNGDPGAALAAIQGMPVVVAVVSTPSGGTHLYVPAQGLGKGKLADGLDYQAGTGLGDRGFVWLPGTVRTPKTGPRAGQPTDYHVESGLAPWPLGGGISQAFASWVVAQRRSADGGQGFDKDRLSGPVRAGGRDNDATAYAASLRRRALEPGEAAELMRARWRSYEQPAGDEYPLEAALGKLESAWRRFEPREVPLDTSQGFHVEGLAPVRHLQAVPDSGELEGFVRPEPLKFLDWHELASRPVPVTEWLVDGILAAGRGHLVYAGTGHGKSLIMLEWAAGLSKAGRRVMYCDWENSPEHDVWPRLSSMGFGPDDLAGLRFLSFPQLRPLDVDGAELVQAAEAEEVEFVVVDTASRTIRGEENSNDTWNAWDRATGVPLRRAGIGFVRMDHAGKDLERGARGGSAKGTDVDLVWRLETDRDACPVVVVLSNEKARVPVPDTEVVFHRMTEPTRHERVRISPETRRLNSNAKALTELWLALDSAGVPEMSGFPSAAAILRGQGLKFDNNLLRAVIASRKLQAQGRLEILPEWAPDRYRGASTQVDPSSTVVDEGPPWKVPGEVTGGV